MPLPIGFALANPALFGHFFQRRFLVCLFFGHDLAHTLSDAYSRLGCRRRSALLGLRNQQSNLAFNVSSGFELFENFSGTPTQEFFVNLGHLTRDDDVAVISQDFDHVRQRLQQPVRRFVEHLGSRRAFHAFQQLAALAGFGREEIR